MPESSEQKKGKKPDGKNFFFVEIRGDQDVDYAHVAPVMQAASNAGISKMNITALVDATRRIEK